MKRLLTLFVALTFAGTAAAQTAMTSVEPFKLGTFEVTGEGDSRIGIVLRDELIIELNAANQALEGHTQYVAIPMPADMKDLIGRYEYGLKHRLYEIVNYMVNNQRLSGENRADFVHEVGDVRTLAPLKPGKMLNAAVNFYSHVDEANTPEEQRAAAERRRANRGIPYLFIKPTEGAVIGTGDAVVIPWGRDMIDWEVELAIVIGRTAKYVSADDAADYISSATWSVLISPTAADGPRIHTLTWIGWWARAMTPLRRWGHGSSPGNFTAIPWSGSNRSWRWTARSCSGRDPAT